MNDEITDIAIYPKENFFNQYFSYIEYPTNTEASLTIHRWCAVSLIGALLGRQFTFQFGDGELLPNSYIQIIGVPATRKSTAIKQAKKLLKHYGFQNFAPEKTSKEKFLLDLHDITWGTQEEVESNSFGSSLEKNLFGTDNPKETAELMEIAETYIASDEFVDFIGRNNIDFISLLGTMWDYAGVYDQKLKHSKAVYINNPTISILAGNTHEGFSQAFPPEIQGQGFFSRLLLIHAEPTQRKVVIPTPPKDSELKNTIDLLQKIKLNCVGKAKLTKEASLIAEQLYLSWKPLEDVRFEHYSGRRFTHLLKLSLICSAARVSTTVHSCDILMANTLLTYAEYQMPKAMGHFGKGKNSAVTHKILAAINAAEQPVPLKHLYSIAHSDVEKLTVVNDIINELVTTEKIQYISTAAKPGYLPVRSTKQYHDSALCKPSWLYDEELKLF